MRKIHLMAIAVLFLATATVSCKKNTEATPEVKKEKVAAVKPEKASMHIEGMTCAIGCAKTIESKLNDLDGVQKAAVDFDKKTATIEYDATIQTPDALAKIIEGVADGKTYKVSEVKKL